MSKCVALVLLVAGVVDVGALDLEFDGFTHFRNWYGGTENIGIYPHPFRTSHNLALPVSVQKDICALDGGCDVISEYDPEVPGPGPGMLGGNMRTKTPNSTTDVYFCHDKAVLQQAVCNLVGGGAYTTNRNWLACVDDFGNLGIDAAYILNTYEIPPALIHSTCLKNSQCVGFRIRNDQSGGDLLESRVAVPGYFLLPN
jgi:hypothetical protein